MITKKQYAELQKLELEKAKLSEFMKSFISPYVWAKVGIIEINRSASTQPISSDQAGYFHNNFTELRDKFQEVLIDDIKSKIAAIDSKMAMYLEGE